MPKYRITDPTSGRVVTVSGDKPPSQGDADAIFSHVNNQQAPKGKLQAGGDFMRSLGLGIFPNIGADAFDAGKIIGGGRDQLKEQKQAGNQGYYNPLRTEQQFENKYDNGAANMYKQVGKDSAGLASWAVPAGGSVRGAVALGAGSGALQSLSEDKISPKTTAIDTIIGALTAGTVKGGSKVLSKGTQKAGQILEKEGKLLPLGGVKISPTDMSKFEQKNKMSVEDFIKNEKLSGNPVKHASENVEKLQDQYDNLVSRDDVFVTKVQLAQEFDKQIHELTTGDYKYIREAKVLADKIGEEKAYILQQFGKEGKMSTAQLVNIRRKTDKLTKPSQFNAVDPLTENINITKRKAFNNAVYQNVGEDQARSMGKKLSAYYDFIEKTKKTDLPQAKSGVSSLLKGGAGATAIFNPHLIPALLAAWGLSKAAQNPRVLGTGAKVLEKAGGKMQTPPKMGASGMDALIRMLRGGAVAGANKVNSNQ